MKREEFQKCFAALSKTEHEVLIYYLDGKVVDQIAAIRVCTENVVYKRLAAACRKFGFERQPGEYYAEIRRQLVRLFVEFAPEFVNHAAFGYSNPALGLDNQGGLYVSRIQQEQRCYQALTQIGGLCRAKGPKHVGKTALQDYVLNQLQEQEYDIVSISFAMADQKVFEDSEAFAKWFCAVIGHKLGIPNQVEASWDDLLANNFNITHYFESYILKDRKQPLVLALDDTDLVFAQQTIANDFCQLLRGWHEQAKRGTRTSLIWQHMRLLILHSTEMYGTLDINSSPLANVGTVITLEDFDEDQVASLAQRNQVSWDNDQTQQLMNVVGGHPALLQETFDRLQQGDSLQEILEKAHTEVSIYASYLREQLEVLTQNPSLAKAFKSIVDSVVPMQVSPSVTFQLQNMGLITLDGNLAQPRNALYRHYFGSRL